MQGCYDRYGLYIKENRDKHRKLQGKPGLITQESIGYSRTENNNSVDQSDIILGIHSHKKMGEISEVEDKSAGSSHTCVNYSKVKMAQKQIVFQ